MQNNVSIYDGVTIEDDVFCGPSCVFTNVNNPRSEIIRKDEYLKTLVKKGASIGANATIVCGSTLGEYCFIAAGATVTKDVPSYALMAGTPAKRIGWMSIRSSLYLCDFYKRFISHTFFSIIICYCFSIKCFHLKHLTIRTICVVWH